RHTAGSATAAPLPHKTSIPKRLVLTRHCVPPPIRAGLLLQPRPGLAISRAAQYPREKPALLTKLPSERRVQMKIVHPATAKHARTPTIMRANFRLISIRRRPPARLQRTRN